MCGVHRAHVPKFASVRCRWAGLCSRCSPFILTWSHWFPLCTEVRLLPVDQGSHLPETCPAEREALQPESFLLSVIGLTSRWASTVSPVLGWVVHLTLIQGSHPHSWPDPDCSLCSPEAMLLITKALLSWKFWIGRQDEPDVCKAIGVFWGAEHYTAPLFWSQWPLSHRSGFLP